MSCYHPVHGMVLACPFGQFDGSQFYNPEYVRTYRKKLLDYVRNGTRGFGIQIHGDASDVEASFLNNQWITVKYSIGEVDVSTKISINQQEEVEQLISLKTNSSQSVRLHYTLDLGMSLNRASYGQLTEGGPIPIPDSRNDFRICNSGYRWAIINENLDTVIEGGLRCNDQPVEIGSGMKQGVFTGNPVDVKFHGSIEVVREQHCTMKSTFRLHPGRSPSSIAPKLSKFQIGSKGQWKLGNEALGVTIRRNLEYILGNCTLPVGKDAVCFITDHVALPLGWNRDN